LESETNAKFDVIVVDAFSSDAIPTHLLNLEAFKLYLSRLNQGGRILLHVSNRFFDLGPVVGNLANELGLEAFASVDVAVDPAAQADGKIPSTWVVVVPNRTDGGSLRALPASWHRIEPDGARIWTDEYADPVSALVW
jgi:spermidine synthase